MLAAFGVFLGGGLGSLLRWVLCCKISTHWGVFLVNIVGAFFIGCAYEYFSKHSGFKPEIKLLIITGLLGGFTTFSTYLLDFITLINNGKYLEGASYLLLSILVGLVFLILGFKVTQFFI